MFTSISHGRLVFERCCVCKRLRRHSHAVLSAVPQTVARHQSTRRITWIPSQVGCTTRNSSRFTFSCTFFIIKSKQDVTWFGINVIWFKGCHKRSLQDYRWYCYLCDNKLNDIKLTSIYKILITEELLNQQRGALIDVHLDGVHLVASGGYAYIAVPINNYQMMCNKVFIYQLLSFLFFRGNQI